MNPSLQAPDAAQPHALLLGLFAEFYEELVRIKQQAQRGTLPDYLCDGGIAPVTPQALAGAVSARLLAVLAGQHRQLEQRGSEAQLSQYRAVSYVMAALADEVLLFDLDWAGQSAWLSVLLEHRLCGSRLAGRRFFEQAEALLASPARNTLQCDLASCYLLALQLGFKGMHRSVRSAADLDPLRERLWRFVNGSSPPDYASQLFPQAHAHTLVSAQDARIAPTAPWLRAAQAWVCGFVVLSSLLWLWLVQPVLR